MTAQEYLNRPDGMRREITRKRERVLFLRRLAARYTAPPRKVTVRSSPDPFRMQALLAEAADLEREANLMEEELRKALDDNVLYISRLPDGRLIRLMELRYVDRLWWEDVADALRYSRASVFRMHQRALDLLPPPPDVPESLSARPQK